MPGPRTEAGRALLDGWYNIDLESDPRPRSDMAQDVREVELEAGLAALAWQVADMKAERRLMSPWESSFSRYEWAYLERLEAAIGVLELRLIKAAHRGKNTPPE